MSLKALIIDDEPLAHKVILNYAEDVSFVEIVGQCHLATEAMTVLKEKEIDLLFLDINMPKLTGLEFLKTLQKKPLVIITSAYEEHALESFELDVCDYLLKPFRFDRFLKAVNKAYELYQLRQATSTPLAPPKSSKNAPQQLFIKADKKRFNINTEDIYFLESYGNYVKVWMGDAFHLTARTLSSFEEEIESDDFFKIHKSYLINRRFINYTEGNFVIMKNEKQLPIGKNQRTAFRKLLE